MRRTDRVVVVAACAAVLYAATGLRSADDGDFELRPERLPHHWQRGIRLQDPSH